MIKFERKKYIDLIMIHYGIEVEFCYWLHNILDSMKVRGQKNILYVNNYYWVYNYY